jgi:hypothetical protein
LVDRSVSEIAPALGSTDQGEHLMDEIFWIVLVMTALSACRGLLPWVLTFYYSRKEET